MRSTCGMVLISSRYSCRARFVFRRICVVSPWGYSSRMRRVCFVGLGAQRMGRVAHGPIIVFVPIEPQCVFRDRVSTCQLLVKVYCTIYQANRQGETAIVHAFRQCKVCWPGVHRFHSLQRSLSSHRSNRTIIYITQ